MPRTPKPHTRAFVMVAALLTVAAAQAGTVEVRFIEPDKFLDAGRGPWDIERTTQSLIEVFKRYEKKLPEGQTLKVEVTDVDLAGDLRPAGMAGEVRVLRGRADWPRISLRYTLSESGRVLRSGETRVDDMSYMMSPLRGRSAEDLAYERRMLDRWFAETVAAAH